MHYHVREEKTSAIKQRKKAKPLDSKGLYGYIEII